MNAGKCLEWCHEVRHRFPQDHRTAHHVLDWLAAKAAVDAVSAEDFEAVQAAIENSKRILGEE